MRGHPAQFGERKPSSATCSKTSRPILQALTFAGFSELFWERFGFFPRFVTDSPVGGLERPLEAFPLWRAALPFQIFGGRLDSRARRRPTRTSAAPKAEDASIRRGSGGSFAT